MSYIPDAQIPQLLANRSICIEPYNSDFQGPNLYYCHLGSHFLIPKDNDVPLNPMEPYDADLYFTKFEGEEYILDPGKFVLAETYETFSTASSHIIRLFNSSSLARCGITHLALGMINPGCGTKNPVRLTLELFNCSPFPVKLLSTVTKNGVLRYGTEVLKIGIQKMDSLINTPYDDWSKSLFGDDSIVTASKMHLRYQK